MFYKADCNNDHYQAEMWVSMTENQRITLICDTERFDSKELNDVQEGNQVKVSNGSKASEKSDDGDIKGI
jgi:hypothetical protein